MTGATVQFYARGIASAESVERAGGGFDALQDLQREAGAEVERRHNGLEPGVNDSRAGA